MTIKSKDFKITVHKSDTDGILEINIMTPACLHEDPAGPICRIILNSDSENPIYDNTGNC